MDKTINPFHTTTDPDRHAIWDMLVHRDIHAFVAQDWDMVADDFIADAFFGVHAHNAPNPDNWKISFPTLNDYKTEWLRQASETASTQFAEDLTTGIFNATTLTDIEITGDCAIAHKKFDGTLAKADGTTDVLLWQTLYYCRRVNGKWKLTGFTGYMPNPMGQPQ